MAAGAQGWRAARAAAKVDHSQRCGPPIRLRWSSATGHPTNRKCSPLSHSTWTARQGSARRSTQANRGVRAGQPVAATAAMAGRGAEAGEESDRCSPSSRCPSRKQRTPPRGRHHRRSHPRQTGSHLCRRPEAAGAREVAVARAGSRRWCTCSTAAPSHQRCWSPKTSTPTRATTPSRRWCASRRHRSPR